MYNSSCGSGGCSSCDDDNDCHCKKQSNSKKSGIYCRSCNEYNEYAETDNIIDDNKYTCWNCGTSPSRKRKGLPPDKVCEVDKIYKK